MTRQFGDDFEAKEEYNFRFGEPDQDGGREHHMVLRQTEGSSFGVSGKLIEMGNLRDGNGDEVIGMLIECAKDDLQSCNLRVYGDVFISNKQITKQNPERKEQ